MSYEIRYFPAFLSNLNIWYAKSFCSQEKVIKAFATKTKTISKYLTKEFEPIYTNYRSVDYTPNGNIPKIIWILWWQGEENMPGIPAACLSSIRKWAKEWDIRILTEKNYRQYLDLDDVIDLTKQYQLGKQRLTIQYLSDLIRTRLLYKHGGVWIDSTMFAANDKLFRVIESLPFFTIKLEDVLLDDPTKNNSSFTPGRGSFCDSFWASVPENPFFAFVNDCMTYHILHHKVIWDYFIIEYSILIGKANIPFFSQMLENTPYTNQNLYWLEKNIYNEFDIHEWNKICNESSIFKLNWRMKRNDTIKSVLYIDYVLNMVHQS